MMTIKNTIKSGTTLITQEDIGALHTISVT